MAGWVNFYNTHTNTNIYSPGHKYNQLSRQLSLVITLCVLETKN